MCLLGRKFLNKAASGFRKSSNYLVLSQANAARAVVELDWAGCVSHLLAGFHVRPEKSEMNLHVARCAERDVQNAFLHCSDLQPEAQYSRFKNGHAWILWSRIKTGGRRESNYQASVFVALLAGAFDAAGWGLWTFAASPAWRQLSVFWNLLCWR